MKILQLVTKRQYRGAEVFAANLSTELIEFGHQIIFAGLYKNEADVLEVGGAKNVDLSDNKPAGFSFKLVKSLIELIKMKKPDVVQCNGSDTLKYMVAASFFTQRIPIIYRNISTISEWIDSPLKLSIYKALFRRVSHVSSVGSESIQDLINTLNYPKNQTSVIRRGIPIKSFISNTPSFLKVELKLDSKDEIVMHIGNFSPEKNHNFLIDIFSDIKVSNPHIKLVCVGDGITFSKIKERIKNERLEKTIFLLGFRKDIPELLSQANCFVLASKIEGVPGVILEAASQRIPTVATNVGGVSEVLIDKETGYIVENFNKDYFKNCIVSLVSNKLLNKQMGEKAFLRVQEEFDPIKNSRKFEELYFSFVQGNPVAKNEELRILQIIQKKQFRGAEVFASQLSNHLKNSGHLVKIISIYDGEAQLPFEGEIESLNRKKRQRSFDPEGWRKLSEIIKSFQPHVVQANASDTLKYAVLSKLIYRWKPPIVYRNASTPSFYIKNQPSKKINAFLLHKIDLIISVSRASKLDLNNLFPFTVNKSIVIPVGVEENKIIETEQVFNPFKNGNVFNLLHVGSFTREKNHVGLISIFQKVLKSDKYFHLNLIGSGPSMGKIKKLVEDLNLMEKVSFLGEIEKPGNYLHFSDALVLPSLVEGLPGVILEAMYNETPVVANDVGGVSEVIIDRETGRLIELNAEMLFCAAILDLKTNKKLRKDIIKNAKTLVLNEFLNLELKEKFIKSYKNLKRID